MNAQDLVGAVLVLLLLAGLVWLGNTSGMLRDFGSSDIPSTKRPYSLARVQMAWWFAIIIGSFVFLWATTGNAPHLSDQALALMGVSASTGLFSVSVDGTKQTAFPATSGKLLIDVLTDVDGITLPRFQMLAVTVILGVIFVFQVIAHHAMPADIDSSLLALMGIAGGTYVGFKIPEQHSRSDDAGAEDHKAGYAPSPDGS